jgi:hypothetical protein
MSLHHVPEHTFRTEYTFKDVNNQLKNIRMGTGVM